MYKRQDEGGLDELVLDESVEERGQDSALGGNLGQLHMVLLGSGDGVLIGLPVVEMCIRDRDYYAR